MLTLGSDSGADARNFDCSKKHSFIRHPPTARRVGFFRLANLETSRRIMGGMETRFLQFESNATTGKKHKYPNQY